MIADNTKKEEIFNSLTEMLKYEFSAGSGKEVDFDSISSNSSFAEDLGLSEGDLAELQMCLEEEFVIEIPDDDFQKITTVRDAVNYIFNSQNDRLSHKKRERDGGRQF